MDNSVDSPGWQAINDALAPLYGTASPFHVGYEPPAALSSNLQGCSAYDAGDHWHYVTYGLSEPYLPGPDSDPAISGWGFELTFRLVRHEEASPPTWPFEVLNRLANFVNDAQLTVPPAGTRINLGQPITGHPHVADAPATSSQTFVVAVDPELGVIESPNGRVEFFQLFGVTDAERDRMVASSTSDVLAELRAHNPLLITHP